MLRTTQNITISSCIPAIYIPGDKHKASVVIAHGIMGCKNEYLNTSARISEKLEERGIGSLRIDFCGHGDSNKNLSEFSLSSQVEDLSNSIRWLVGKGYSKVVLVGISFGAPPAIIASELFKDVVEKCVLIAPVIDYKKTFVYPQTSWGRDNFGYDKLLKAINNNGLALDEEYVLSSKVLLDMLLVDVPSFVEKTNKEILIFHGDCDNMVPLMASMDVAKENDNVTLSIMFNTEHGLTEVGDEKFEAVCSIINLENIIKGIV